MIGPHTIVHRERNNPKAAYFECDGTTWFTKLIVQRALWLGFACGVGIVLSLLMVVLAVLYMVR